MERHLYHASVRDHDHVAVMVALEDRVYRRDHARFEKRGTFTSRDQVPVRLLVPARPRLWETVGELLRAQALPVAAEDLAQPGNRLGIQPDRRMDRLRSLKSAREIARVEAREPASGKALTGALGLAASFLG